MAVILTAVSVWFECLSLGIAPRRHPDAPIESDAEDEINRRKFVEVVANRILTESTPVIALVGPYGEGKTSTLNMLASYLNGKSATVVHFKTWVPGDSATLVTTLFNSISKALSGSYVVYPLRRSLTKYARVLSGIIPSAPHGLQEMFRQPSQEEDLEQLRSRLGELPLNRVVVLLDEMDRMQSDELRTLLKVIRAAGDYPKLTFVCAFHKDALAQILSEAPSEAVVDAALNSVRTAAENFELSGLIDSTDSRFIYEYLEKFFPVQIALPRMDDASLAEQFNRRFDAFREEHHILTTPDDQEAFTKQFEPVWESHFKHSLTNIRKLNSYFNALRWSFAGVRKEVNLFDFMLLELLRQTEPTVYEEIYSNRRYFYYPEWEIERWSERDIDEDLGKKERYDAYKHMLRGLHGSRRAFVSELLDVLFPRFAEWTQASLARRAKPDEPTAEINRRIFHPAFFSIYYTFQVPAGYVGGEELEAFIVRMNGEPDLSQATEMFSQEFAGFNALRRMRFLERLVLFEARLNDLAIRGAVLGVSNHAGSLEHDILEIGEYGAARRLVFSAAKRFQAGDEIMDLLTSVIRTSTSDRFAADIYFYTKNRDRNGIISQWDHIRIGELETVFTQRMKQKYHPGGNTSIYAAPKEDRDALFQWLRAGNDAPADIQAYLRWDFSQWPMNIGAHILWLWPTITHAQESRSAVDQLLPLDEIVGLIRKSPIPPYSSDNERNVITELLKLVAREVQIGFESCASTLASGVASLAEAIHNAEMAAEGEAPDLSQARGAALLLDELAQKGTEQLKALKNRLDSCGVHDKTTEQARASVESVSNVIAELKRERGDDPGELEQSLGRLVVTLNESVASCREAGRAAKEEIEKVRDYKALGSRDAPNNGGSHK